MGITIEIDIEFDEGKFDLWLSDNCGGSGISVRGNSAEDVAKDLTSYIEDYLIKSQYDTPFEWENLKYKIGCLPSNKITFEKEGVTLDNCDDENIVLYSVDSDLYAETNKGKQYLPSIIEDEDDFFKIEDLVDEKIS